MNIHDKSKPAEKLGRKAEGLNRKRKVAGYRKDFKDELYYEIQSK